MLSPKCYIPRLSLKAFLALEKKVFKCFYHIWADFDHLYKLSIPINFNRRLHMKFEENWPRGFRGKVVQTDVNRWMGAWKMDDGLEVI